jgi:hypothetical protein
MKIIKIPRRLVEAALLANVDLARKADQLGLGAVKHLTNYYSIQFDPDTGEAGLVFTEWDRDSYQSEVRDLRSGWKTFPLPPLDDAALIPRAIERLSEPGMFYLKIHEKEGFLGVIV